MIHPKNLSIKEYTYDLTDDRIAKYPLSERDASKLLIYESGKIIHDHYRNLDHFLPAESLLIFNDTKVIEARILFQKPTGGIIEIFCLEPHEQYHDIAMAMSERKQVLWQCLIGGASKWKHGQILKKKLKTIKREVVLTAQYVEKRADSFVIAFSWDDHDLSFAEILHQAGAIPLPPYLKREAEISDTERYQTIFAHHAGSVASPTAGLHFTESLLKKLEAKNIKTNVVTLHVGAGTFKPVKTDTLEHHEMHPEFITISRETIENISSNLSRNIIPVGTTSLRTIESMYWLGVKLLTANDHRPNDRHKFIELAQWEAYELEENNVAPQEAFSAVLGFLDKRNMKRLLARTQLLIAPSYKVKIANGLITNFHQPQSTLLLLVAALIGEDWKSVYNFALANDFRFLSYGDGCLLWFNRI